MVKNRICRVETLAVMTREDLQKSRKKKSLFLLFLRLK